jgi:hypothetical protein
MRSTPIRLIPLLFLAAASPARPAPQPGDSGLGVIAIGDAGEKGRELRGAGQYVTDIFTGSHDAGRFRLLLFLGDNFYPTGLNIPLDDVEGTVSGVLRDPFQRVLEGLGPAGVHAIPGNHDYYARNAIETSIFFGLFKVSEAPVGLSGRGNVRELKIPQWTYHFGMPAELTLSVDGGQADSVQFIFFDSAPLLRTPPDAWRGALDSLARLLKVSAARPALRWRVLCTHHPLATMGEHGGYGEWDDEQKTVVRLTTCDRDSNALGWVRNLLDPEDICTDRYRGYVDSLGRIIRESGARIQLVLSGHDHSLQLLRMPGTGAMPRVQIVSGAGSLTSRVAFPNPPAVYTSARLSPDAKGESRAGFVHLQFGPGRIRIRFYDSSNGDQIDMGGGRKEFFLNIHGDLEEQ